MVPSSESGFMEATHRPRHGGAPEEHSSSEHVLRPEPRLPGVVRVLGVKPLDWLGSTEADALLITALTVATRRRHTVYTKGTQWPR